MKGSNLSLLRQRSLDLVDMKMQNKITKKIFSVGLHVKSERFKNLPFRSEQSLFDADIILFSPSFLHEYSSHENFEGKRLISASESPLVDNDIKHWRAEISEAYNSGKTIFVFLTKPEEEFVHTGKKNYSGTGRSRVTENIVVPLSSYSVLPVNLGVVTPKAGSEIRARKDLGPLSLYWERFKRYSSYEVYLDSSGNVGEVLLMTKSGEKIVGSVIKGQRGSIVLLPPLNLDTLQFFIDDSKTEKRSEPAAKFGARLAATLFADDNKVVKRDEVEKFGDMLAATCIEVDKALRSRTVVIPPPPWTLASEYKLQKEIALEEGIKEVTSHIESLTQKNRQLNVELVKSGSLRKLLYENGAALEEGILEALKLLGFKAERYKENGSEFDAIFSSEGRRFLGEAEGKDNKPINIEKLSQLERNLQEDFAREDVSGYAKGVLFGNAHRLLPLSEREEYFTEKCISGAQRSKVALVRTPDLFPVAKYLKEYNDPVFAKVCRDAILNTDGDIVQFPAPPNVENLRGEADKEKVVLDKG